MSRRYYQYKPRILAPETSSDSDTDISEWTFYSGPTVIDETPSDSDSESEHYPDPQNDNYSDSEDSDATADLFNDAFDEGTDPSEGNNQDGDNFYDECNEAWPTGTEEDYSSYPHTDPLIDNYRQWCVENNVPDYDDNYDGDNDEDGTEQEEFNEAGATGTEEYFAGLPSNQENDPDANRRHLRQNVPKHSRKNKNNKIN